EAAAVTTNDPPLGPAIDPTPAERPGAVILSGHFGSVERLDAARHGPTLWEAMRGHDDLWAYNPFGPFAEAAGFSIWLAERAKIEAPLYFAIVDPAGRAIGIATLMEIRPKSRVIEVGHICYSPALQRTPLGTEAQFLLARYVFETLRYRRYEWKCNVLNQ